MGVKVHRNRKVAILGQSRKFAIFLLDLQKLHRRKNSKNLKGNNSLIVINIIRRSRKNKRPSLEPFMEDPVITKRSA